MNIYDYLNKLNIEYKELEHNAVYTIEEAIKEDIPNRIGGTECKNLFVKNKNNYYLIFMECNKRANLKEISSIVNESKLSFANIEELKEILDLDLGSVTPLGIINDINNKVTLILDKELNNKEILVHPLVNTKTIKINFNDLIHFIESLNHKYILY